jgi:hypothetical protein
MQSCMLRQHLSVALLLHRCYGDKPREFLAKVRKPVINAMQCELCIIAEHSRVLMLAAMRHPECAGPACSHAG